MKKIKIGLIIAMLLVILIAGFYYASSYYPFFIVINGEQEVLHPVGQEYVDLGAKNRFTETAIQGEGEVDWNKLGSYTVEYTQWGTKWARSVQVVDQVVPTLQLPGGAYLVHEAGKPLDASWFAAIDNYDGECLVQIEQAEAVQQAGTHTLVLVAEDSSGNRAQEACTVLTTDRTDFIDAYTNRAGIDEEMVQKILDFKNAVYRSLYYMRSEDVSGFYSPEAGLEAYRFQKALDLMVNARRMSPNNVFLDNYQNTLRISSTKSVGGGQRLVKVYEDNELSFHYLPGEESRQHQVLSEFTFDRKGNSVRVYQEEGYFLLFDDEELEVDESNYKAVFDRLYEESLADYTAQLALFQEQLDRVNSGEDTWSGKADHAYDRQAAVRYADAMALTRNPQYPEYESNCMNYVSQVLHAGGIPIDYTGSNQWKNYSLAEDWSNSPRGFNYSFIRISYFQRYLHNTVDPCAMVVEQDINFWLGEEGDIAYVGTRSGGYEDCGHVVIISKVIRDADGNIIDFFIDGNTNDQYNYPMSAGLYGMRLLGKVHGYNE